MGLQLGGSMIKTDLDFWHGCDVDGLDVVFELLDLLAELFDGDLVVLDDAHDLQFVDAVTDGNKFGWKDKIKFKSIEVITVANNFNY